MIYIVTAVFAVLISLGFSVGYLYQLIKKADNKLTELSTQSQLKTINLENSIINLEVILLDQMKLSHSHSQTMCSENRESIEKLNDELHIQLRKVKEAIPVTNTELEARVAEVEKQSHTMRMSM